MPADAQPPSRRAFLGGGALGLVVLSGCGIGHRSAPSRASSAATPPSASHDGGADQDSDERLAARARQEIELMVRTIETIVTAHPKVRSRVAGLTALHQAHLATFSGLPGNKTPAPVPTKPPVAHPKNPEVAYRQIAVAEQRLQQSLAKAASEARSGALARLLAGMSASIGQHLAVA